MDPLNRVERKKAFIHFLWLFLLCMAIFTTMIFFSIKVPVKENQQLRSENDAFYKEREFSKGFTKQMVSISEMLDSINSSKVDPAILEEQINLKIGTLNTIITDSNYNKDLYLHVVRNLADLKRSLKELRGKTDKDEKEEILNNRIQDLEKQKQDLTTQWLNCVQGKR